jgi:hypothetical protein
MAGFPWVAGFVIVAGFIIVAFFVLLFLCGFIGGDRKGATITAGGGDPTGAAFSICVNSGLFKGDDKGLFTGDDKGLFEGDDTGLFTGDDTGLFTGDDRDFSTILCIFFVLCARFARSVSWCSARAARTVCQLSINACV